MTNTGDIRCLAVTAPKGVARCDDALAANDRALFTGKGTGQQADGYHKQRENEDTPDAKRGPRQAQRCYGFFSLASGVT